MVGLLTSVSIATVRTAALRSPQAEDMRAAAAQATSGVMMAPACAFHAPAAGAPTAGPAALAAPPAIKQSVATTAAAGQAGATAAARRGHADMNP
jgi:hypothetical protein